MLKTGTEIANCKKNLTVVIPKFPGDCSDFTFSLFEPPYRIPHSIQREDDEITCLHSTCIWNKQKVKEDPAELVCHFRGRTPIN